MDLTYSFFLVLEAVHVYVIIFNVFVASVNNIIAVVDNFYKITNASWHLYYDHYIIILYIVIFRPVWINLFTDRASQRSLKSTMNQLNPPRDIQWHTTEQCLAHNTCRSPLNKTKLCPSFSDASNIGLPID